MRKYPAMILPSTADRTGGVCMACAQGIRKDIENSKEYYRKLKEYDPYRELWKQLVDKSYTSEGGFESLTHNEQVYYSVGILEGEVYNGGFHQFFTNTSGRFYSEVLNGLEHLGATNAQRLLIQATRLLFGDVIPPMDRARRWEVMKHEPENDTTTTPDWVIELEKLDRQYWKDPDGINDRLTEFAKTSGLIQPFLKPK